MEAHGVGALLVTTADELVGIVTDRDLALRGAKFGLLPTDCIEEIMTREPSTIQGSDDILDALAVMRRGSFRRLPVLEEFDIAGIITADDLLVWLVGELAAVATPAARDVLFNPDIAHAGSPR
jgi:CBS domain-containing protein